MNASPRPAVDRPRLTTLHAPPSWLNRAGRVDRSACLVLAVGALWRRIPGHDWRRLRPGAHTRRGKPIERVGRITLTAHDLWVLHRHEPPERIAGDRRTPKSNALKAADAIGGLGAWGIACKAADAIGGLGAFEIAGKTADGIGGFEPAAINPNRGVGFAMRRKVLGLPAMWEATLTIERIRQHARLSQHFWVCPACGGDDAATGSQSADTGEGSPPGCEPAAAGRRDAGRGLPRGRVTKLYLPLCTEREWQDAQVAHLWLQTHQPPNRPLSPGASALIKRYAELFPGRRLRCRQCLGLRYGEVK